MDFFSRSRYYNKNYGYPSTSDECYFFSGTVDNYEFYHLEFTISRAGGRFGKSLAAKMASQIFGNRKKKNYLCCSRDNFIDMAVFNFLRRPSR